MMGVDRSRFACLPASAGDKARQRNIKTGDIFGHRHSAFAGQFLIVVLAMLARIPGER